MRLPRPKFSLRTLVILPLLVTSAVALWLHWEPWRLQVALTEVSSNPAKFADNSVDIEVVRAFSCRIETYCGKTGRLLGVAAAEAKTPEVIQRETDDYWQASSHEALLADGRRRVTLMLTRRGFGMTVIDVKSRRLLAEVDDRAIVGWGQPVMSFSPDGESLLVVDRCTGIYLFRRRRPEWWWGVFYLWEFWLTAAFCGLFIWSVVRDRRVLN